MTDEQTSLDELEQTWDNWFLSLPKTPPSRLPDRRPLAPSRAVRSPRKAQGPTSSSDTIGVGYEPTTEEDR